MAAVYFRDFREADVVAGVERDVVELIRQAYMDGEVEVVKINSVIPSLYASW